MYLKKGPCILTLQSFDSCCSGKPDLLFSAVGMSKVFGKLEPLSRFSSLGASLFEPSGLVLLSSRCPWNICMARATVALVSVCQTLWTSDMHAGMWVYPMRHQRSLPSVGAWRVAGLELLVFDGSLRVLILP